MLLATDLLGRARLGDEAAFEALLRPVLKQALGAAALITRDQVEAEDVVQEAMVQAWRSLGDIRSPDAFGAWFRRVVVRTAVRSARRTRKRALLPIRLESADRGRDSNVGLERDVELRHAFATLEKADRAVIVLRFFLGYSTREAGAVLGIPEGTVKSRLHAAIQRLRQADKGEDDAQL